MKKLLFAIAVISFATSCHFNFKRVKGNGNIRSEERRFGDLSRIKIRGGINVDVTPGAPSLKVEADENLLKYIETYNEDGWIVIKSKDEVNLRSDNPIKVFISTDKLTDVRIAGSGKVNGTSKFNGSDRLNVDIAGSGDVSLNVNTPKVYVGIHGSGTVTLSGETKDAKIDIAGSGDYLAEDLLTENTDVEIKGSGDAKVYADNSLKAEVMGSGAVLYRGKARVQSSTTGSGKVRPMQ